LLPNPVNPLLSLLPSSGRKASQEAINKGARNFSRVVTRGSVTSREAHYLVFTNVHNVHNTLKVYHEHITLGYHGFGNMGEVVFALTDKWERKNANLEHFQLSNMRSWTMADHEPLL